MQMSLDAAEHALAAGRYSDGLGHLIAAFDCRAVALAELIEEVSDLARQQLPDLAVGKREAMQKEWLALERRHEPRDVPRLLRALTQTHWRSIDALARAKRVDGWPPDPRVPALLVDQLLHPPFSTSSSKPFWKEVFRLIERHADPRTADLLRGYVGQLPRLLGRREQRPMRTWMLGRANETLAALERAFSPPPVLSAPKAERVARCRAIIEQRRMVGAALLEAVFADPTDDTTRWVLADHLQEAGDPRGEIIALQLARGAAEPRSGAERSAQDVTVRPCEDTTALDRERALLRRHRAAALGPLCDVLQPELCVLKRGFLSQAWLRDGVSGEALARVVGNVWWSTVIAIHGPFGELEPLVRHPVMRGLQHLSTTNEVFAARRLPLVSVTVPGPDFNLTSTRSVPRRYLAVLDRRDIALMARSRTFRGLQHLGLRLPLEERAGHLAFLKHIDWARRLRQITLFADGLDHAPLAAWVAALGWISTLKTISIERGGREWALVLSGSGRGRWSALDLLGTRTWLRNLWPAVEEAVALGVRRLTLVVPAPGPAQHKLVDRLCDRTRDRAPQLSVKLVAPPPCVVRLEGTPSLGDAWRWLPGS